MEGQKEASFFVLYFFSFLGGKAMVCTSRILDILLLSGVFGGRDHPLTGGPAGTTRPYHFGPHPPHQLQSCSITAPAVGLCAGTRLPPKKPIIFFRDTGGEPRSVNERVPHDFRVRGQGGARTASDRRSKRRLKN